MTSNAVSGPTLGDAADPRVDRLYALLPTVYRIRDAERGYPLRALLRVIAEQVNVVEDDIARRYENWFVETADDWAVPYIGDLVGYAPVSDAGRVADPATDAGRALDRVLVPRREVANTIRYRRRKGTIALLEQLAFDVAGWPARAVELYRLLGWNQNVNHPHLDRARVVDVRKVGRLDLLDGPFDAAAHSVDVRRIDSHRTVGRFNIPSVGVYVWRTRVYSVTKTSSYCVEDAGPHCHTFSVLGQDTRLYARAVPEPSPTHIARETNLPVPIRRRAFAADVPRFYGKDRSLAVWAGEWAGHDPKQPIPASAVVVADLTDWQYVPPRDRIAVDPALGRFAFPPSQLPKKSVRVSYHYGFTADMGGGEYARTLRDPAERTLDVPADEPDAPAVEVRSTPRLYRVGRSAEFPHLVDALRAWKDEKPYDAVVELTESGLYAEPLHLALAARQTLQIRAASGVRPVVRLLDWHADRPDALAVTMARASRFTLDGLVVTGRGLHVTGPERETGDDGAAPVCAAELVIRHCTLVPGWAIDHACNPKRPAEPSLELYGVRAKVRIEHSILGSIEVNEDEVALDPIPLCISDSIVDATSPKREAIGAPGYPAAHVVLDVRRSTVFGVVNVHTIDVAEDSIFEDCVNVVRRQLGCMRYCYVPPGCRTLRRYACQPDLVEAAATEAVADPAARAIFVDGERLRVRPQLESVRYGTPGYARLTLDCADEIRRGAEDESEMGAFHDLYQPQREDNLRARLDEFTPAGTDVGIIFAS